MSSCMLTIQKRLVRNMSTKGAHKGLMTQGKYNQLVYRAISVLEIPSFLYMMTDRVMTTTYGIPWPK